LLEIATMSTRSHRRSARRHPELATNDPQAVAAIASAILSLVTLGAVAESEPESEEMPPPTANG
jgi:hypothetical protein